MEIESVGEVTATVRLSDPDVSSERLEELTTVVRDELLASAASSVALAASEAPPGARAPDGSIAGELVVTVGAVAVMLRSVIGVLKAWRERRPARTVEIEIDGRKLKLTDATKAQQERLVEDFLAAVPRD
ncbi:hypothetical protein J4573_05455 [Actinomadura barringtoniae]|uniref:Uncharacterized protein n=1 Tax=Actinomadura barringtoniae TaxID=1427535 RepID=A0A939T109_9ACTN|nr:hypothetical protein [Actinomadura barringtoniae]MBO2446526.1 hypothetical protein [Actinomadura barringtoniae]